ncbi:MAG TPA: TolC family protein [Flavipsychrobacter sp.]|nr:TolC family protein [Flavipsychrobacter sp.]
MRGYFKNSFIALSLSAGFFNASAQDQTVNISLKDALDYTAKNNIQIKNSKLDVLIQIAKNAQVTAAAYPKLNGSAQFMDYIDPMKALIPGDFVGQPGTFIPVQFSPKYSSNANINASQILFDGSVVVALQARKTVVELAEQAGKLTEVEIKYNVQKAYYSLAIAHRQFDILKSSISFARTMAGELSVMKDEGFVEKIDVDRANVQVNNLVSDSLRTANLLEVSEQLLKYQMGMDIKTPIRLVDTNMNEYVLQANSIIREETDYDNRYDYLLSKTQLKGNEFNLKRYKLAALPSLVANGSMGYNYGSNYFNEMFKSKYIWSSYVALQLNVPIFNGFQRTNQVRETKLDILKSKNNIEFKKQSIDFETSTARATLKNNLLQFENEKRNLELANSVLELARIKYKEGVGSSLEVTQAQTEFLRAQGNYFNTMLNIITSEADLQKALGLIK